LARRRPSSPPAATATFSTGCSTGPAASITATEAYGRHVLIAGGGLPASTSSCGPARSPLAARPTSRRWRTSLNPRVLRGASVLSGVAT
jgi:hypothetical protein